MAKLNPKFKPAEKSATLVVDNTPTEMERLYSDAEDEDDFTILVVRKFGAKLSSEQTAILKTLAIAFYRSGPGKTPKADRPAKPKDDPVTAQERFNASVARAAERLRKSQEEISAIEERARVRFAADVTFHELWVLGNTLGKKDDKRRVSEHTTKAQLKKAGVEIE